MIPLEITRVPCAMSVSPIAIVTSVFKGSSDMLSVLNDRFELFGGTVVQPIHNNAINENIATKEIFITDSLNFTLKSKVQIPSTIIIILQGIYVYKIHSVK